MLMTDKVLFSLIWAFVYLLTAFLLSLKLTLYFTLSWWWVFFPIWGTFSFGLLVILIMAIWSGFSCWSLSKRNNKESAKRFKIEPTIKLNDLDQITVFDKIEPTLTSGNNENDIAGKDTKTEKARLLKSGDF